MALKSIQDQFKNTFEEIIENSEALDEGGLVAELEIPVDRPSSTRH